MNDPLNVSIPLKGVDATFPLLPEADYELTVAESKINPNYDKSGLQWDLSYALVNPAEGVNGKPLKAGTRFFPDWPLQLQPRTDGKGGSEWEGSAAQRSLCSTVDTLFSSTMEDRPEFNRALVEGAVGKSVIGHITIDTDKNGVQRNKVTRIKKAA